LSSSIEAIYIDTFV